MRLPSTVIALIALPVFVCGCGKSSSTSSAISATNATSAATAQSGSQTIAVNPPTTGCGSFSAPLPPGPTGALAQVPVAQQQALAGYQSTVLPSAWNNWHPQASASGRVALVLPALTTPFEVTLSQELKKQLLATPGIKGVDSYVASSDTDIPQQLQQLGQALQNKDELIITQPLAAGAAAQFVNQAGRAGVPVVTYLGNVDSPYAVNVDTNYYLGGARTASYLVRAAGGKGQFLHVAGYPVSTIDQAILGATKTVIKRCPGASLAVVVGAFSPQVAKSAVLTWLASHPGQVAGVQQSGSMGHGIISAFQSTGRPVPSVSMAGADNGSLAYWKQQGDKFKTLGFGVGAGVGASTVVGVVRRMLEGQGLRINAVVPPLQEITSQNLDQWVLPGSTPQTPGTAEGPNDIAALDAFLNPLFRAGHTP
jgi:ribose transport system substrate-binding protein